MACKSLQKSPSSPWIWKYDVFLSFRGDDTRCNFTDHLYAALHRNAIITFKDDIKLKKGKTISKELLKAIEETQICIVVFSKNYASSTWCLEELAKIAQCIEHQSQSILPVFYDLDPSDVRKHTGNYGKALARYEETFTNIDKVQKWKEALSKVANLSGWDVRNNRWTSMLQLNRLVELFMPGSSFKQLWEGIMPLYNLRIMDLSDSVNLIKTPDFRGFPNLKHLHLRGCTSLSHVEQSIGVLSKLECIILEHCASLVSLPSSIFCLTSLQGLGLSFCSKLNNPLGKTMDAECLEKFDIEKSTSAIVREKVMSPFQFFSRRCEERIDLLLPALQSLQVLNLGYCNLQVVPRAIGLLQSLEALRLVGNNFVSLPLTINNLPRLAHLSLGYCKELQSLPELTLSTKRDFSAAKFAPHLPSCPLCASGLFIFNCPKLVENQNSYSRFALSWLTTLAQEPHHQEGRLDFVIPGSRIPEWFNHQNLGSSTRVQLPQSSDWIGVAICATLVPNGYDIKTDYTAWETYYHTSFTVQLCSEKDVIRIRTPHEVMRMLVRVESVHLWLFYLPREMSICTTLLTWQVGNDAEFRASGKDIKVTRCGVRWVYKQDIQDLELLNAAMNNC